MPELQEVFVTTGEPTYTFVKPQEYNKLLLALKTPGKGIVIEGPSGIGKTTAIKHLLRELQQDSKVTFLSARNFEDMELITNLNDLVPFGIVIIDDFHRLNEIAQKNIADKMKHLADISDCNNKLIVIGINQAGKRLIEFGLDLATRIEIVKFEANSIEKVLELIELGENALNITIKCKQKIAEAANGSFYMAQELSTNACLQCGLLQSSAQKMDINISAEDVIDDVFQKMDIKFNAIISKFAVGPRFRKEGRAPYYHLLKWLGEAKTFSIHIPTEMNKHVTQKPGVTQIYAKGYLENFITSEKVFEPWIFLSGENLIIQDPQLVFYLSNLDWEKLREQIGYSPFNEENQFDFALSFAGENRNIAKALKKIIEESEISIFYDNDHAAEMLAENVDEYLAPIYASQAKYIICILSKHYPRKVWTVFESKQYKEKIQNCEVIPIVLPDCPISPTDPLFNRGRIEFSEKALLEEASFEEEVQRIAAMLTEKLCTSRQP